MPTKYENELGLLDRTYAEALELQIERLEEFVDRCYGLPLIAIGSGGSLTAAYMAATLHQAAGGFAKAMTPLEYLGSAKHIGQANILLLSAGGKNKDILSTFRYSNLSEPSQLMTLCARKGSPLAEMAHEFRYTRLLDFNLACGKDGFLATNSLIAFIVLLLRAYVHKQSINPFVFPTHLPSLKETASEIAPFIAQAISCDTWVFLHGVFGKPPAMDAESKLVEAALKNVQVADYRNFAHGRHHWLAKRGQDTSIISLITPSDEVIARKTLKLLPDTLAQGRIIATSPGPMGALELMVKVFQLVWCIL